jgi:hypothetical protein
MSKHTAGPWRTIDGDSVVNVVSPQGLPIAATTSKAYFEKFDYEDTANARLIAAAPDLLEALAAILPDALCGESHSPELPEHEVIRAYPLTWGTLRAARAAISKATGEPLK